jgi:hypothetical protein
MISAFEWVETYFVFHNGKMIRKNALKFSLFGLRMSLQNNDDDSDDNDDDNDNITCNNGDVYRTTAFLLVRLALTLLYGFS